MSTHHFAGLRQDHNPTGGKANLNLSNELSHKSFFNNFILQTVLFSFYSVSAISWADSDSIDAKCRHNHNHCIFVYQTA